MKWEQIQGRWQEFKGEVKQRWGKLTDQDILVIDGRRDVLAGKLLEYSTNTKEQIEREISAFEAACASCGDAADQAGKSVKAPPGAAQAKSAGRNPSASGGSGVKPM